MVRWFTILFAILHPLHARTPLPGHAEVRWITASHSCPAGESVQTAVRLTMDPGWHTYWIHPGETGIPTEFAWTLPSGWSAQLEGHPLPERFTTDGITGFGYSGVVNYPVRVTAPRDFTGEARLEAKVTWLACGESGCVPGEATLPLVITAGGSAATPEAAAIDAARSRLPTAAHAATLEVERENNSWRLILRSSDLALDPTGCEVFPLTPHLLDLSSPIRFSGANGRWSAVVPISEYFDPPPRECVLVIGRPSRPWFVRWESGAPPEKIDSTNDESSGK
jgi:DsbC/DsbD-like thiol-disulfide interchange protein